MRHKSHLSFCYSPFEMKKLSFHGEFMHEVNSVSYGSLFPMTARIIAPLDKKPQRIATEMQGINRRFPI